MNFTALALLTAAGLGQAPPEPAKVLAGGVKATRVRQHKLGIEYTPTQRENIAWVELVVSQDRGQTWSSMNTVSLVDKNKPANDYLLFTAPDDGLYYASMVIHFKNGTRSPVNPSTEPPEEKILVDATPPQVRLTAARRAGDEVVVDWQIDDQYPDDAATEVVYKPAGTAANEWTRVPNAAFGKRSVRFRPGASGPLVVQVTVFDLAGNLGKVAQEVPADPAAAPADGVKVGYTPEPPGPFPTMPPTQPPPVLPNPVGGPGPIVAPAGPIAVPPSVAVAPTFVEPPPVAPAPAAPPPAAGPQPIAQGSGVPAAATWTPNVITPVSEPPPAGPPADVKVINMARFGLPYNVDGVGASGVSKVDLYVTRDDGRSWKLWSRHAQNETPLRVALDQSFNQRNPQAEGDYGFRLVPTSGAGLSEGAPPPNTPPEVRVRVDLTPPFIQGFPPEPDPVQPNAMVLKWTVTDTNKSAEPVLIEWSAQPGGPWASVAGPGPAGGTPGTPAAPTGRIPDTGTYTWQLPPAIPAHKVYLRYTAWDAAGNKSVVATQQPFMIDPHKPRARIQGIMTDAAPAPRP